MQVFKIIKRAGIIKGERVITYISYDEKDDYSFNVDFSTYHILSIFVQVPSKVKAKQFKDVAGVGNIDDNNPKCIYLDKLDSEEDIYYYNIDSFDGILSKIKKAMEVAEEAIGKMSI